MPSYVLVLIATVLATLAAAGIVLYVYLRGQGCCYVGRTKGGLTWVHDDWHVMGERIRVLEVGGTYQSATYLDERWANPVFPYHLLFDHLFDAWPQGDGPRSVAVLGGGGYAIPKHLVAHHPQIARVDVVEIDPAIEGIAREYFFLDRLEEADHAAGRLHLHIADALTWLERSSDRFDVIVNDCFSALTPEATLMTIEGIRVINARLNDGGLYLTNVVSALEGPDANTLYTLIGALRKSFAHVWVYPCSPDYPSSKDNNVVVASNARHDFKDAWEWPES